MLTPKTLVAAGCLALCTLSPLYAQPAYTGVPIYTNPYAPYNYNGPLGGYMSGAADVINAQSAQMTEQQRARLLREQVQQKKIETRRKLFEERQYELANTPTLQDEREATRERELRRAMKTPTMIDIWSGASLNAILDDAIAKQGRGIKGPMIPLNPDDLAKLNVTTGTGGNVGILRENGGKLTWPVSLLGAQYENDRKKLEALFGQVSSGARAGTVDRSLVPQIDAQIASLQEAVRRNIDDLSTSESIEAKRYLSSLSESTKALKQPNAANYLNGKWEAKGKTVDDLVRHMKDEGIRFAPAAPGNEPVYLATYSALAAFNGSLVTELKANTTPRP
jgi:hypothetical protein